MSRSAPCAPSKRIRSPGPAERVELPPDGLRHMAGSAARSPPGRRSDGRRPAPPFRAPAARRCDGRAPGPPGARGSAGRRGRPPGSPAARPCPRTPVRCRAPWCRSWRPSSAPPAPGRARRGSGRISGVFSAIISVSGVISTPCSRSDSISCTRCQGSSTTPLPITLILPDAHDAGGQRVELVGHPVDDQRVAGIVAALEAHDHVRALGEPVDDLALALVAPLGADHHDIGHVPLPSGPPPCLAAPMPGRKRERAARGAVAVRPRFGDARPARGALRSGCATGAMGIDRPRSNAGFRPPCKTSSSSST